MNELEQIIDKVINKSILKSQDIPSLDLYMDQIMTLFETNLNDNKRYQDDKLLTKTMINNYSKAGIIKPVKGKKYTKEQIIGMLIIYNLKNIITIQEIKDLLLPIYETNENLEIIYDRFIEITTNQTQLKPLIDNLINTNQLDINDKNEKLIAILVLANLANQIINVIEGIIDNDSKNIYLTIYLNYRYNNHNILLEGRSMKIIDLLHKRPTLSFEIFPPKNYDGDISSIYQTIDELSKLKPDFISVTYGAGGSTTKNTVEIASKIKNDYNIEAVAHLSCIDASPKQLIKIIDALKENKIENILSLRGDYPKDYDPKNTYHYFKYASELNEFITKNYPDTFCLSGACYPEVHQEATSLENDLDALKKKVDAGAQYLITQIFFDNNYYYRLLREARIKGQCPYYCWDNASN